MLILPSATVKTFRKKKIQGMKLHQTLRKNNEALNDIGISREERKKRKSRGG